QRFEIGPFYSRIMHSAAIKIQLLKSPFLIHGLHGLTRISPGIFFQLYTSKKMKYIWNKLYYPA
ncbi:MAG: hypothetical protein KDD04_11575, partial [Sinomicrobium sp.]|nr:hypothetical protein [Sinomicrobium sp.]